MRARGAKARRRVRRRPRAVGGRCGGEQLQRRLHAYRRADVRRLHANFKHGAAYRLAKVEQGCALLGEWSACVRERGAGCQPRAADVREFKSAQMYACELLVPSLKEHVACFSAVRTQSCDRR